MVPEIGPNLPSWKKKRRHGVPVYIHFDVNNLIRTLLGNKAKIEFQKNADGLSTPENKPHNFTCAQPYLFIQKSVHGPHPTKSKQRGHLLTKTAFVVVLHAPGDVPLFVCFSPINRLKGQYCALCNRKRKFFLPKNTDLYSPVFVRICVMWIYVK